jgi:dTDP-4-amino-4,6-dideoxygalactose transaminase
MIPIFKPYMPEGIMPEIEKILYSGNLAFGKYGKLFEQSLKEYIGNERTLTVSSYNHAMLIVLSTLGLKPGDEVIASPVSCLASNQPFIIKNLKVIWADVNPKTGSINPDDIRKRITSKTKAIFHNHYCGYVGEIEEISKIAKEFGLIVIDDAIEAFGAEFQGEKIGNIGSDITVFSFQTVRLPNTIDGAAISFKDQDLFEKALKIRDYGIDRSKFRNSLGEISDAYDIKLEGYGALMSEINSYIGIEQMKNIESLLAKQQQNAIIWNNKISEEKEIVPLLINKDTIPNYWVYGVLCENKIQALEKFRSDGWYATGVHINNNIYSVFNNKEELKGVNEFINSYLALPCGWWFDLKV